jgi:hypothetical protein
MKNNLIAIGNVHELIEAINNSKSMNDIDFKLNTHWVLQKIFSALENKYGTEKPKAEGVYATLKIRTREDFGEKDNEYLILFLPTTNELVLKYWSYYGEDNIHTFIRNHPDSAKIIMRYEEDHRNELVAKPSVAWQHLDYRYFDATLDLAKEISDLLKQLLLN